MNVRYQLDRRDYAVVLSAQYGSHWYGVFYLVTAVAGTALLFFGTVGVCMAASHRLAWLMVSVIGLILLIAGPMFLRMQAHRVKEEEIELTTDEAGIDLKSGGTTIHFQWADFSHFKETGTHFLLYGPAVRNEPLKAEMVLIPKRAFGRQELTSFESTLRKKLMAFDPT